jgi:hypothetical protein
MIWHFFSSQPLENDFRMPLIKALIAKGHKVWHIRINRLNVLTHPDNEHTEFAGFFGFIRLVKFLRVHSNNREFPVIFVDSTGACVPIRSLILRALLRGIWCFDIFDNLLYELRGLPRFKRWLGLSLLAHFSQIKLVLSRDILCHFPSAYHFDNAAHTKRISRAESDFGNIVILFSIDNRFDFELVNELAVLAPELKIYLYGRLAARAPKLESQFGDLCAKHSNLIFRGEYRLDEIEEILAPFVIGLMPYATNSPLTKFINPDKYYLFLNSGMEVISTDIPQARYLADHIHIVHSARQIVSLLTRLQHDSTYRKNVNFSQDFTWEQRAEDLVAIVQSHISSDNIIAVTRPPNTIVS